MYTYSLQTLLFLWQRQPKPEYNCRFSPVSWDSLMGVQESGVAGNCFRNLIKHGDLSAMAHPTSQVISGPYGLIILTSYLILIISFSLDVLKIARLRSDTPR